MGCTVVVMINNMYYYTIKVYIPYDGYKDLILSHEKEFDDLTFHSLVQDAIDEAVMDWIKNYSNGENFCNFTYWNLWGSFQEGRFRFFLAQKGFMVIDSIQSVKIEEREILSDERYKNIELPQCKDCYLDKRFEETCSVVCKRLNNTEGDKND